MVDARHVIAEYLKELDLHHDPKDIDDDTTAIVDRLSEQVNGDYIVIEKSTGAVMGLGQPRVGDCPLFLLDGEEPVWITGESVADGDVPLFRILGPDVDHISFLEAAVTVYENPFSSDVVVWNDEGQYLICAGHIEPTSFFEMCKERFQKETGELLADDLAGLVTHTSAEPDPGGWTDDDPAVRLTAVGRWPVTVLDLDG